MRAACVARSSAFALVSPRKVRGVASAGSHLMRVGATLMRGAAMSAAAIVTTVAASAAVKKDLAAGVATAIAPAQGAAATALVRASLAVLPRR